MNELKTILQILQRENDSLKESFDIVPELKTVKVMTLKRIKQSISETKKTLKLVRRFNDPLVRQIQTLGRQNLKMYHQLYAKIR